MSDEMFSYTMGGAIIGIVVGLFLIDKFNLPQYAPFIIMFFSLIGFIYGLFSEAKMNYVKEERDE